MLEILSAYRELILFAVIIITFVVVFFALEWCKKDIPFLRTCEECPICGSDATELLIDKDNLYFCKCHNCGHEGIHSDNIDKIYLDWNV